MNRSERNREHEPAADLAGGLIEIHYLRPPGRLQVYVQELVVDEPDLKITLADDYPSDVPVRVGERTVLEQGAPIVWFVLPGEWYDLGLFHLNDGTFTGYYTNFIAPARLEASTWELHDLCLDLWLGSDGHLEVLDREEFDEAVKRRWIDAPAARRASQELERVLGEAKAGRWPPARIRGIDLARVRSILAAGGALDE